MGVADSLRKARNLRPVTDMLGELAREQERQESFKNVLSIVDKIKNNMNQFQQPPITSTYETAPKPTTNMQSFVGQKTPNATMDDLGNTPKSSMSKGLNVNVPQEQTVPNTRPNPFKLQDIGKVTETQTEGEAPGAYETEKYYDEQMYGFLKQFYSNPDNTPEAGQFGMNLLSMIKPKADQYESYNLNEGDSRFRENKRTGKTELIATGGPKKDKTKKDFKVIDGYYAYWDETSGDWIKTNGKAPKTASLSDQLLGWEKFKYQLEKEKEEESEGKKTSQVKYNNIMGAPFLDTQELINQGLIEKKDPSIGTKGGGYLVRDDDGKQKIIFTDENLENYANTMVPDAPNKWTRTKGGDKKKKPKPY